VELVVLVVLVEYSIVDTQEAPEELVVREATAVHSDLAVLVVVVALALALPAANKMAAVAVLWTAVPEMLLVAASLEPLSI
jgi:hypothetical protein